MVRELKKSEVEEDEAEKHGFIYRFHPSLDQRIAQLKRMGAKVAWNDRQDHSDLIDGIFVDVFLLIIALIVFLASRSSGLDWKRQIFSILRTVVCDATRNFESNHIILEHLLSKQ